jgi:hypothetical protein
MRSWLLATVGICTVAFAAGILIGRVTAPSAVGSGITGKVMLNVQIGTEGRSFPQSACQRVLESTNGYDTNGAVVARFCSGKNGSYRVSVPPGKYMIVSDQPNRLQTTGSLTPVGPVEVRQGAYTAQDVHYENGGA